MKTHIVRCLSLATLLFAAQMTTSCSSDSPPASSRTTCCVCSCALSTATRTCSATTTVRGSGLGACSSVCASACDDAACPNVTAAESSATCEPGDGPADGGSVTIPPPDGGSSGVPTAQEMAAGFDQAAGLVLAGSELFWGSDAVEGSLATLSIDGGSAEVLASGQPSPEHVAVDATHVYWTVYGVGEPGAIRRVPRGGGPVEIVASGLSGPVGIAVAVDSAFVALWGDDESTIARFPLAGGPAVTLVSGPSLPRSLVPAGERLYFTDFGFRILRVPLDGGELEVIHEGGVADQIAVDEEHVYWASPEGVMRVTLSGPSQPQQLAPEVEDLVVGVAVDETHVYWATAGDSPGYADGVIAKVEKGGGEPIVLADSQRQPSSLAVGPTHVFWTNAGNGKVMRASKSP